MHIDFSRYPNWVTLVNRTSKVIYGQWDGKQIPIEPGENKFPAVIAQKFKEQHPVMGSQDPYSMHTDYLLGIVDYHDPVTPMEQSTSPTLVNLATLNQGGGPEEYVIVKRSGLYRNNPSEFQSPLPQNVEARPNTDEF
jgi:hypothetical protein